MQLYGSSFVLIKLINRALVILNENVLFYWYTAEKVYAEYGTSVLFCINAQKGSTYSIINGIKLLF